MSVEAPRRGRPPKATPEQMRAEMSADVDTYGPLMTIAEDLADLTDKGFTSRTPQRRVSMTVQQMGRLARLLSTEEIQALALFAEFMVLTPTEHGEQFLVEGFNEAWLKAHGMNTTAARKANSLLKARGMLIGTTPDGSPFLPAGARSHVVLADRFCGIESATPPKALNRRGRPSRRADHVPTETSVHPDFGSAATAQSAPVDNMSAPTFGISESGSATPVDNISPSTFGTSESGRTVAAKAQVSPTFVFPTAGTTSSSSREVSSYPCTTDQGDVEGPSLVAFLRDQRLLAALRTHQARVLDDVTAAFKRLSDGEQRQRRAAEYLTFLGQPVTSDPLRQIAQQALGLVLVEDAALADTSAGIIGVVRGAGVNLSAAAAQNIAPSDLCLTVAMSFIAATDFNATRPAGWLYRVLTGQRLLRHDGAVREFLMALSRAQTMTVDDPDTYGAADVSNPAYLALLDDARVVAFNALIHARDDAMWADLLKNASLQQRLLREAEEIRSGKRVIRPAPENWRDIAAGFVDA